MNKFECFFFKILRLFRTSGLNLAITQFVYIFVWKKTEYTSLFLVFLAMISVSQYMVVVQQRFLARFLCAVYVILYSIIFTVFVEMNMHNVHPC